MSGATPPPNTWKDKGSWLKQGVIGLLSGAGLCGLVDVTMVEPAPDHPTYHDIDVSMRLHALEEEVRECQRILSDAANPE